MLNGLFKTLIKPDREEHEQSDRGEVAKAANILQVGEFQLLQLAYYDWFDEDLPEPMVDQLFREYMLKDQVPHWARYYARKVIEGEKRGLVDINHASFHRYDAEYITHVPKGVRRFSQAAFFLFLFVAGGMVISHFAATGKASSVLPPYFDRATVDSAKRAPNPTP